MGFLRYRSYILLLFLLMITVLTAHKNIFIHADNNIVSIMDSKKENELFNKITASATQFNVETEDAYLDSVWKETPCRKGKIINVVKSYENINISSEFIA